jgi:hypothetical protein
VKDHRDEWQQLYRRAMNEGDPKKLAQLTRRINELLQAKELRLLGQVRVPNGGQIFQIAYDEMLLVTRAELLRGLGYEVTSALGNEDARRVLSDGEIATYHLFIIGHAAQKETRQAMVRWLELNSPKAKVLALNPHHDSHCEGADYNFILNGPEEWLAAVASVAGQR